MIVLDTHALVWWLGADRRLSPPALLAIERELTASTVFVSSISAWEIAMLSRRNKLDLSMDVVDWLEASEAVENLSFVPVDNTIAAKSQFLPGDFHPDPADRIIVALARELAAPLVTADGKIQNYPHVETIW
ncbi:MAG: type II toxin-antitoxin system VapC family toxin [Hyphomicrobiales bacterium]|nr:type II toxin-antitoxin system VapC family toxin [Hyphomicrobiales bacterium]